MHEAAGQVVGVQAAGAPEVATQVVAVQVASAQESGTQEAPAQEAAAHMLQLKLACVQSRRFGYHQTHMVNTIGFRMPPKKPITAAARPCSSCIVTAIAFESLQHVYTGEVESPEMNLTNSSTELSSHWFGCSVFTNGATRSCSAVGMLGAICDRVA